MAEYDFSGLENDQQPAQPQAAPNTQQAPGYDFSGLETEQPDAGKYEGLEQTLAAAAEGAGQGAASFLAPMIEQGFGIPKEDILGRAEAHPIAHGIGEAAGFVGSLMTPIPGLGAAAEAIGHGAQAALALAKPASWGAKVGSATVKAAAEMAVLQGSDEASKMVLSDPKTSAESAIANIGLAAALGGASGGFLTGVVNPLWEATAKPQLDRVMTVLRNRWNGVGAALPEELTQAEQVLGVQMPIETKAAVSSPNLGQWYKDLKSEGKGSLLEKEAQFRHEAEGSLFNSLGKSPEEFINYDKSDAGRKVAEDLKSEFLEKVTPISDKFDELQDQFKNHLASDQRKAELTDAVVNLANDKGWMAKDVPQSKVFEAVSNRIPKLETAADFMNAIKEVGNIAKADREAYGEPAREFINILMDKQADVVGDAINETAPKLAQEYAQARQDWAQTAQIGRRLSSELSLGTYKSPKAFIAKMNEKLSPEQILSRMSPKGNAEVLQFMQEHFPKTLENIRESEMKRIISPAVTKAKEGSAIDLKILQNKINSLRAGDSKLLEFALPPEFLAKSEAAEKLLSSIPSNRALNPFDREIQGMPQTAMGALSWLMGEGFLKGAALGQVLKLVRGDVPQAVKLGLLKFAASDQPIQAGAFRASVDYMANMLKSQKLMEKSTKAVFGSGAVLASNLIPVAVDRTKLDDIIEKTQEQPDSPMSLTNGQVGHYFPEHQTALTETASRQIQYLQQLKPKAYQNSPLDRPIEPSEAQKARYYRALDIANQPYIVLQHVKDGSLQASDIQDLNAMYPGMYQQMVQQLSNQMIDAAHNNQQIPYKTKIGLSLFMGQPLDSSMNPNSIVAAQPKPQVPSQQPQNAGKKTGSPSKLGQKVPAMYQTPGQNAEKDRSSR